MSKFLLTVCAFGLLLSFAFAEEKSPEQHRKESNQMLGVEGVQKMKLTRVVASGTNQRIYFFYAVHPDCSASDINIRVTKQPEHGTVETAAATDFPNFGRENIFEPSSNSAVQSARRVSGALNPTSLTFGCWW